MTVARLPSVATPAPADLASRIVSQVRDQSAQVLAAGRRVRKGGDEDAIHDLRVASRRLSATLALWGPASDDAVHRRARRALRRLRRRLGRVREREVLLAQLVALAGEEPALAEALEGEVARLTRRVERGRARAARLTRPTRLAEVSQMVERCVVAFTGEPAAWLRRARTRVEMLRRTAFETIAEARAADDDARLHQGRVALKRWRYALESLAAAGVQAEALPALKSLQQALGAINDAVTMRDYLTRRSARDRARGRPARAASLEQARARAEEARQRERAQFAERFLASGFATFA